MIETHAAEVSRLKSMRAHIIRCTCAAGDAETVHGRNANGQLNPCPNGRIEYVGELREQEALCEHYGCSSWEELRDRFPIRFRFYQAKVRFEERRLRTKESLRSLRK